MTFIAVPVTLSHMLRTHRFLGADWVVTKDHFMWLISSHVVPFCSTPGQSNAKKHLKASGNTKRTTAFNNVNQDLKQWTSVQTLSVTFVIFLIIDIWWGVVCDCKTIIKNKTSQITDLLTLIISSRLTSIYPLFCQHTEPHCGRD